MSLHPFAQNIPYKYPAVWKHDSHYNFQTTITTQKFWIGNSIYEDFITQYCDAVKSCSKSSLHLDLQESKSSCWSGLVFDIDIHKSSAELLPLYRTEDLTPLFEYLLLILLPESLPTLKNKDRTVTLLTKEPYWKSKRMVSHGIHLQCINIFVSPEVSTIIQSKLKEFVETKFIFAKTVDRFEVDNVAKKPWYLYGSSAKDKKPYIADKTWAIIKGKVTAINTDQYIKQYVDVAINDTLLDWKTISDISYFYPLVFSITRIWKLHDRDIAYDYVQNNNILESKKIAQQEFKKNHNFSNQLNLLESYFEENNLSSIYLYSDKDLDSDSGIIHIKRKKPGECLVDQKIIHDNENAYCRFLPDGAVALGCYRNCKLGKSSLRFISESKSILEEEDITDVTNIPPTICDPFQREKRKRKVGEKIKKKKVPTFCGED